MEYGTLGGSVFLMKGSLYSEICFKRRTAYLGTTSPGQVSSQRIGVFHHVYANGIHRSLVSLFCNKRGVSGNQKRGEETRIVRFYFLE